MTEQKLQDDAINLIDDILDKHNSKKKIKKYRHWGHFVDIVEDDFKSSIETITIDDDINIPSDDRIAIDRPKKIKIITDPNRLRLASDRIKKKYFREKSKGL